MLKDNHPALLEDARSLFETIARVAGRYDPRTCQWWDLAGFTAWPQVTAPIPIVRSVETGTVQRQLAQRIEEQHTD
ncbi:MAG: hypothetical protein AB1601_11495 [Planctomycetota bacterium]